MNKTLKGFKDIGMLLEFYRELGFDILPFDPRSLAGGADEDQTSPKEAEVKCGIPAAAVNNTALSSPRLSKAGKEAALSALREEIGDCRRCRLESGRTTIVFGEGSADAAIMFIGEAPGREEDIQSRPFVGDAGQLLTRLIERMNLRREDVYIANIIKCRPPSNRDPQEDEIAVCRPFLDRQIEIIAPKVIVSLGKISAYTLLGITGPIAKFSITRTRGKFHDCRGIPLMPTFHPAYLLRNPKDKWLTWEDAQAVLRKLEMIDLMEE